MSQFAHRAVVWIVAILLLIIGVFLQVRSARSAPLALRSIVTMAHSPRLALAPRF